MSPASSHPSYFKLCTWLRRCFELLKVQPDLLLVEELDQARAHVLLQDGALTLGSLQEQQACNAH